MSRHRKDRDKIESNKREIKNCWKKGMSPGDIREKLHLTKAQYDYCRQELIAEESSKVRGKEFRAIDKAKLFKDKPFWIWDGEHGKVPDGRCCFNHLVGLPEKNGKPMPLFDYEKRIIDELEARGDSKKDKHLWLKKATGLGVSELFLRYMSWLCYRDGAYDGTHMCIVTGPNINLAKGLIRRIKRICAAMDYGMPAKETAIILNGCRIEAFPSHHLDAMRSLPNPKFILIDEADFFPLREQQNARDIAERYIAKSDPYIVMVSTPNMPGGLFDSIEKEPDDACIYRRIKLDYTAGLGRIYTEEEIQKAMQSPSFEREYNLKYGHGAGKIFPLKLIEKCTMEYPLALQPYGTRVLAVDPAFGSSKFAIVGVEQTGDTMYVKEAKQFERPSFIGMLDLISVLAEQYPTVLVDSAFPSLLGDLSGRGIDSRPVNFRSELQKMTTTMSEAIKEESIKIHPAFEELLYQLKAVTFNERGNPDKRKLSYDLGDSLMMAVHYLKSQGGLHMAAI